MTADQKDCVETVHQSGAALLQIINDVMVGARRTDRRTIVEPDRAAAIRRFFIERYGITPERITARGLGEHQPEASNATKAGRSVNRRAVARIYRLEAPAAGPGASRAAAGNKARCAGW